MPTVYLHIGAPKTATSTLQRVLAKNHRRLLKAGILYPKNFRQGDAHHVLACDLMETHLNIRMPDIWYGSLPRQKSWAALLEEIGEQRAPIETVILSTELLFGQNHQIEPMLKEMKEHLSGFDIRVIAYLRRQDQLYSSFYNQDVKGVRQWAESAYEFYETHQLFRHNYLDAVGNWTTAFGKENILLRPFEAEQWPNGSIVEDFCAAIGIETLSNTEKEQNESIGSTQFYIKLFLNKVGFPKVDNEAVLALLEEIYPEQPSKQLLYINRPLYRKYRTRWLHENRALSKKYLSSGQLFSNSIPGANELEIFAVKPDDLVVFIGNALKVLKKEKHSKYRTLFTKAILMASIEQGLWDKMDKKYSAKLLGWL